jgi:hypothetical protein
VIVFAEGVATLIVFSLFDATWSDASIVLDIVAVAAIVGSVAAYNRLRTALGASEAAATAWHEERDAAVAARDRITEDLKATADARVELIAKVAVLEQRPDLTKLESLVQASTDSMLRHETQAAARTDRLIGAIEALGARTTTTEEAA